MKFHSADRKTDFPREAGCFRSIAGLTGSAVAPRLTELGEHAVHCSHKDDKKHHENMMHLVQRRFLLFGVSN